MTEPWTTIAGAGAYIMTGGGGGAGGGGGGGGAATLGKEKNDRFCAVTTMLPPAMFCAPAKPSASQSAADGSRSAGDATFAKVVGGAEAAISAATAVRLTMDRKRLLSPM
jgi:hypothetical protein